MGDFQDIRNTLSQLGTPERAAFGPRMCPPQISQKPDLFHGTTVPDTRGIAKKHRQASFELIEQLLSSSYHEEKLCGLMILKIQTDTALKKEDGQALSSIKKFYLSHLEYINHWDLVDESAHRVLGNILLWELSRCCAVESMKSFNHKSCPSPTLQKLASSNSLWQRRISIISQFSWLRAGNIDYPLSLCRYHVEDQRPYIQKAVGWILREVGKRDRMKLDEFLKTNIQGIGSVCLSYALEKHTKEEKADIRALRA